MELAATTYSFRDHTLPDALDCIARAGVTAVEIWLPHVGTEAAATQAALAARGLRAVAVSAGGAYRPDDDAVERAAALALALGARHVVACVAPGLLPRLAATLDPQLTLCVENHWDQQLARPDAVLRELASAPLAAACLDTGHALAAGIEPSAFAGALGARLAHVHLKDAVRASAVARVVPLRLRRRARRGEPPLPGQGDLDVAAFAAALAARRYRGAISIEYEGRAPERALAALAANWRWAIG